MKLLCKMSDDDLRDYYVAAKKLRAAHGSPVPNKEGDTRHDQKDS